MKWWQSILILISFFLLLALPRFYREPSLRAGDTVKPVWAGARQWIAGGSGLVTIQLQARGEDDSAPRMLGFDGLPIGKNPTARIVFFEGENPLSEPVNLILSHRC